MAEIIFVIDKVNGNALPVVQFNTRVLGTPAEIDAEAGKVLYFLPVLILDDPVKRQHQADIESKRMQLPCQGSDHIRQTSRFGKRSAFRTGH